MSVRLYSFPNERKEEIIIIVGLFVDDAQCVCNDDNYAKFVKLLKTRFGVSAKGEADQLLSINIIRLNNKIYLSHRAYIIDMLKEFNMTNCNPKKVPISKSVKLTPCEGEPDTSLPYRRLVGKLIFLSCTSKPELSQVASYLGRFSCCYDERHFRVAKNVLKYLKYALDECLVFKMPSKDKMQLYGYSDSTWHSHHDGKSQAGWIIMYGDNLINQKSYVIRSITNSSMHGEIVALSDLSREAVYTKRFFNYVLNYDKCAILRCDNDAACKRAHDPISHDKSKHIKLKDLMVQEHVDDGYVKVLGIDGDVNPADMFTKPLDPIKFEKFKCKIGIERLDPNVINPQKT